MNFNPVYVTIIKQFLVLLSLVGKEAGIGNLSSNNSTLGMNLNIRFFKDISMVFN